jgi:ribose 1,5-bisphosphokinase PhnN
MEFTTVTVSVDPAAFDQRTAASALAMPWQQQGLAGWPLSWPSCFKL